MDLNNDVYDNSETNGDQKIQPGELLEERWFFGNFLDRKQRMLRSFSDPCTSSNYNHELFNGKSYEETYDSIKKLSESETGRSSLIRTPSMPPSLDMKKDRDLTTKGKRKSKKKTLSNNNLMRTPSLPTSLEEFHDEDTEFSMGKLIRQASMKNSDTLPPRTQTSKGVTPNSSLSRHRSRTRQGLEPIKMEGLSDVKPRRRVTTKLKSQKSFNDLSEELKGFKDLGINPNRRELNRTTSLVPSLPERKKIEENDESNTRRRLHSSAPPVPKCGGKRSTEDVKAQIKFWARAVASNVRQEC